MQPAEQGLKFRVHTRGKMETADQGEKTDLRLGVKYRLQISS